MQSQDLTPNDVSDAKTTNLNDSGNEINLFNRDYVDYNPSLEPGPTL